jgi:hypothetical protein
MGVSKASLRGLPIDQRIERMQAANKPQTVRVTPVNDVMRNVLAHPQVGHFPAEGSMEWPDDGFTLRRIQDGDITVEKSEAPPPEPPVEKAEEHKGEEDQGEDDLGEHGEEDLGEHGEEHGGRRRRRGSKGESSGTG